MFYFLCAASSRPSCPLWNPPRKYRQVSALYHALCQRHKALPSGETSALPSPSAPTSLLLKHTHTKTRTKTREPEDSGRKHNPVQITEERKKSRFPKPFSTLDRASRTSSTMDRSTDASTASYWCKGELRLTPAVFQRDGPSVLNWTIQRVLTYCRPRSVDHRRRCQYLTRTPPSSWRERDGTMINSSN